MGCNESREDIEPQETLLPASEGQPDDYSIPMSPRMGQSKPLTQAAAAQISSQHERLILELLPVKDARQFHEWLSGIYVRGSWHEFLGDFLARNPLAPELDKAKISQLAKDAVNSRNPKYLMYHPDKEGWTSEDYHIRFISTVITDNLLNKGLWTDSDWKKKSLDITKAVYEVLSFLRATTLGADAQPPRYED
ncbi:hypothetical protein B0H67DRAFT_579398 [Lasiosphaeris hirsuta]|uniref:Uncharacterized protein n=1 Tax=Lasiosphaeris hirsuta TaxID=260670 RepID=A0AA40DVN2_9PEZI|nr:hypothetical protein B0H67DRAFT_579398 [Lasiosphaeris hirsuta]